MLAMQFSPFAAVRYNDPNPDAEDGVLDLEGVVTPFLAAADPAAYAGFLEQVNTYNAYRLLTDQAPDAWRQWLKEGILVADETPRFYCYRIGYRDNDNQLHQVSGVIGELHGVEPAADSGPADVVPVVARIEAPGFSELLAPTSVPLARATDSNGVHHRLWAIDQTGIVNTISEAVEKAHAGGCLEIAEGTGTRMAFVTETVTRETLPALGMTFRQRSTNTSEQTNR
jgi:hypothetical protein